MAQVGSAGSHTDAKKRRDFLDAGATLFATVGFEKTTIRDLAAEARSSTGTFYAYFDNKADLLDAVIADRLGTILGAVRVAAERETSPLEAFIAGLRVLHRHLAVDTLLKQVITFEAKVSDRDLTRRALQLERDIGGAGLAALQAASDQGELPLDDPEATIAVIGSVTRGWLIRAHHLGPDVPEERLTDAVVALLRAAASK